jgi:hypothetical protein
MKGKKMKLVKRLYDGRSLYEVEVSKIQFDLSYQRPLSNGNKKNIKDNFDHNAVGIITLCKRRGTNVLNAVDGQHRVTVLSELIEEGSPLVRCNTVLAVVIPNTTRESEAGLFETLNTNKPVTGNNKTRARIVSGKSPQKEINACLKKHGFRWLVLNPGRPSHHELQNCGISQSTPVIDAYKQHGEEVFDTACRVLKLCWVENGVSDKWAMRGTFLAGLCHFVKSQQGTIDANTIDRLQGSPIEDIMDDDCLDAAYSSQRPAMVAKWLATTCGLKNAA